MRKILCVTYVSYYVEERFPGCVAVVYEGTIVIFWPLAPDERPRRVSSALADFMDTGQFCAGISYEFDDLSRAWAYYREAYHAMYLRLRRAQGAGTSLFDDCALEFVISNMVGEFDIGDLMPRGLLRILRHDSQSPVSYWETLDCYLSKSMSATETARELCIHRSTFLQRMATINNLLDYPLDDPAKRDYVRFCMRAYNLLCGRGSGAPQG